MTNITTKTDLPVVVIVAGKALLLYVFLYHSGLVKVRSYDLPFLPFLGFLDPVPAFVYTLASFALLTAVFAPFILKDYYRPLCLLAGIIILFFIISSKLIFSNSLTFVACLLILIGLYRDNSYTFRIQISLIYLGAGINKFFTPDWWNGNYMDYFLREIYNVSIYSTFVPGDQLMAAAFLGIVVIGIELLLALTVLFPKYTKFTISLGLIFHGGMLIITQGALSVRFFYIMSAAFLLISNLRINPISITQNSKILHILYKYLDLTDTLTPYLDRKKQFSICLEEKIYTGKDAAVKLLLSRQSFIFFLFASIVGPTFVSILSYKLLQFLG